MKKCSIMLLMLLMLIPAALFAQGGQEDSEGPVEIEFMAQWPISENEKELLAEIEEIANVKVKYNVVANRQQRDTVAARLASGDLPDIFFMEDVQAYQDAYLGELIADITQYTEEMDLENIKAEISQIEDQFGYLFQENDGHYYRLPARRMKAYGWYWVYRKDWADAAGVSYEQDNFLEFCKAITEDHPKTVGFTAYGAWAPVTAFTGAFTGAMPVQWNRPNMNQRADGSWYTIEMTDEYREGLKYLNKLYEAGVMDPEVFSLNRDTAVQKFIQGKSAVLLANSPFADALTQAFNQAYPDGEMDAFAYAPKPAGAQTAARGGSTGYYKSWIIGKNSEEKTKAALRFLNALKSPEIREMATRDEKWELSGGGMGNHTWTEWTGIVDIDYEAADPVMAKGMMNANDEVAIQNPLYVEYSTDISAQYKPEVASVMEEYSNNFITGKLDIDSDADWNAYLKAVDKSGLEKIIDDINNFYK